jgi:hypothetical protein
MNTIEEIQLYAAAQRVVSIFYEHVVTDYDCHDPKKPWFDDRWRYNSSVEPSTAQTRTGLYLDFYNGIPSRLWTQWGVLNFARNGSSNRDQVAELAAAVKSKLGLRTHQENYFELDKVTTGPIYGLLVVDGKDLPEPSLKESRDEFMPYDEACAKWAELTAMYVSA